MGRTDEHDGTYLLLAMMRRAQCFYRQLASEFDRGFWLVAAPVAYPARGERARRCAPVFYPLCGRSPEMQGFGGSTYRPSYRHPGVATCSLGKPGPILGSAATGTARSAVGGSFQTFLAEHRARATGVSL